MNSRLYILHEIVHTLVLLLNIEWLLFAIFEVGLHAKSTNGFMLGLRAVVTTAIGGLVWCS